MSRNNEPYFSNPFADSAEDPFQDPAVAAARQSQTSYALEDDSPPLESVQLNSTNEPNNAQQNSQRERDLAEREAQLAARERALQQQAENLRLQGGKPPNFPPFYPIYYMDIEVEIPEPSRKIVRTIFKSWFVFIGVGVINFVTSILNLASKPEGLESTGTTFGTALFYMLLMPFPAFFFWYRPVYNAFMKERAFFYFVFFVFNGFHILYLIYMTIGVPGTGSCGLINTIIVLAAGKILASIFGFVTVALWAALALLNAYLFIQVHRHCQEVGHSFSDAKSEAMSRAARTGVARDAAGSYARQQFSA